MTPIIIKEMWIIYQLVVKLLGVDSVRFSIGKTCFGMYVIEVGATMRTSFVLTII